MKREKAPAILSSVVAMNPLGSLAPATGSELWPERTHDDDQMMTRPASAILMPVPADEACALEIEGWTMSRLGLALGTYFPTFAARRY